MPNDESDRFDRGRRTLLVLANQFPDDTGAELIRQACGAIIRDAIKYDTPTAWQAVRDSLTPFVARFSVASIADQAALEQQRAAIIRHQFAPPPKGSDVR